MTASFFEELAAAQTPAPVKRKMDAAERRAAKARQAEKDIKEQDALSKLYRKWKREQREALVNGPFGRELRGIFAFLDTMTLSSAPALIRLVESAPILKDLPAHDRGTLLGLIGAGIAKCREKAGLQPFDDEIPFRGEPPKAFSQIKTLMGVR